MHMPSCRFSAVDCETGCDCRGCPSFEPRASHESNQRAPSPVAGRCPHCGSPIHKAIGTGGAYCAPCDDHLDPWEYA